MERNRAFLIWLGENVNIKGNCYRGWKQCQRRMLNSAPGRLVHQSTNPHVGISWNKARAGSGWNELGLHREHYYRFRIGKFRSRHRLKDSTCLSFYLYLLFFPLLILCSHCHRDLPSIMVLVSNPSVRSTTLWSCDLIIPCPSPTEKKGTVVLQWAVYRKLDFLFLLLCMRHYW